MSKTVLQDIAYLMKHSDVHKTYSKTDFERLMIPPVILGQYHLLHEEGKPVGYMSWAHLTDEAKQGLIDRTRKIQPNDWNAGDNLWFMDFIAPFGNVAKMILKLKRNEWKDKTGIAGWARFVADQRMPRRIAKVAKDVVH